MGKFEDGMKAGAKPFEEASYSAANAVRKSAEELKQDFEGMRDNFNDLIDVIAEDDPLNRKEILENIKIKNQEKAKPVNYTINVVYTDAYQETADSIRESLNQQGNTAIMQSYKEYQSNNKPADFCILLGMKCGRNDKNLEVLLDANGCHIDKYNNHIYVYTQDTPLNSDEDWGKFLKYYQTVTEKTINESKAFETANSVREKRLKRDKSGLIDGVLDSLSELQQKSMDLTENLPWFLQLPVGGPIVLFATILSAVGAIASIPFGISEIVVNDTLNRLEKRDITFVSKAQLQILLIKVCEYIRNQQLINMVDKQGNKIIGVEDENVISTDGISSSIESSVPSEPVCQYGVILLTREETGTNIKALNNILHIGMKACGDLIKQAPIEILGTADRDKAEKLLQQLQDADLKARLTNGIDNNIEHPYGKKYSDLQIEYIRCYANTINLCDKRNQIMNSGAIVSPSVTKDLQERIARSEKAEEAAEKKLYQHGEELPDFNPADDQEMLYLLEKYGIDLM